MWRSSAIGEDAWAITVGAMANMVGLVHFGEPADLITASRLAKRYGHRRMAAVQTTIDDLLGTGPALPVATRMVMVLALTDWVVDKRDGRRHGEGRGRPRSPIVATRPASGWC